LKKKRDFNFNLKTKKVDFNLKRKVNSERNWF